MSVQNECLEFIYRKTKINESIIGKNNQFTPKMLFFVVCLLLSSSCIYFQFATLSLFCVFCVYVACHCNHTYSALPLTRNQHFYININV